MLSAFTARPIIELRQRDKSKIETILAYGMRPCRQLLDNCFVSVDVHPFISIARK